MESHVAQATTSKYVSDHILLSNERYLPSRITRSKFLAKWKQSQFITITKIKDHLFLNFILFFYLLKLPKYKQIYLHGDFYFMLLIPIFVIFKRRRFYFVTHDRLEPKVYRWWCVQKMAKYINTHITTSGYNLCVYSTLFEINTFRPTGAKVKHDICFDRDSRKKHFKFITIANDYPKKKLKLIENIFKMGTPKELERYDHLGYISNANRKRFTSLGIYVHGTVPNSKVSHFLGMSDILVIPSKFEGTPKVFFEALANGCCLILHSDLVRNQTRNYFELSVQELNDIGIFTFDADDELDPHFITSSCGIIREHDLFGKEMTLARISIAAKYSFDRLPSEYDQDL